MSEYQNVVGGKLKLKGKALDVKAGGCVKKKKKLKHHQTDFKNETDEHPPGGSSELMADPEDLPEGEKMIGDEGHPATADDHLTPAERRYIEQKERINMRRMAKTADKSHRDRIESFNQYLANLSEHYDIPKVGPG